MSGFRTQYLDKIKNIFYFNKLKVYENQTLDRCVRMNHMVNHTG